MSIVGFAVIGCGMIAKFHIAAIGACTGGAVIGVFDRDYSRAQALAESYGLRAYRTCEEIWADPAVQAVCICTPSGLHCAGAMEALDHGRHVLVEKPMALTLSDADAMIRKAAQRGLHLGVVSQLRFSPAITQVKRAIDTGVLGRLLCADLYMKFHRSQNYYDASPWRGTWAMDGGGALMNQGIHGVDLLQYLAGPINSIFCRAATLARKIEVEDTLSAVTEFQNGAIGVIQATTSLYSGFSRRMELCGEHGTIILEEDNILLWDVADDRNLPHECGGVSDIQSSSDPNAIGAAGHIRQLSNFIAAIQDQDKLLIDGPEGCKALQIIQAAYRSAQENRPVFLQEE